MPVCAAWAGALAVRECAYSIGVTRGRRLQVACSFPYMRSRRAPPIQRPDMGRSIWGRVKGVSSIDHDQQGPPTPGCDGGGGAMQDRGRVRTRQQEELSKEAETGPA